jgi:hypothetical protein
MTVRKPTAFLLIATYLAFLGIVNFHIHEGLELTNHLHCKLCEIHKLSVERVIDSSVRMQLNEFGTFTFEAVVPVMLEDPLLLSGLDPPRI